MDIAVKLEKYPKINYSQAVAVCMAGQLFNILAIREISQGLRFGINPLARGDFLDFFNLLLGFQLIVFIN
jgi:hypothetical protein